MATLVPIPKLGQSEETVTIVKWRQAEGAAIRKGDVLFEVETDKAVLEVESQFEGTLLKIVIPAGREVPVMSIAAVLGTPGEALPPIPEPPPVVKKAAAAPAAAAAKPAAATRPTPSTAAAPTPAPAALPPSAPTPAPAAAGQRAVSPRARTYARDFLIRLDAVTGSGPGGRVVQRDVEAYLAQIGYSGRRITPAAASLARQLELGILDLTASGSTGRITVADVRRAQAERAKPMPKIRQVIARRLTLAKQTIPHFYVTASIDMTDLLALRKRLKETGLSLSLNDFILKAVARALVGFPVANSSTDDGVQVRWHSEVNIGMAVSIEGGLVVPVLRRVDAMPLDELHEEARELASRARDGKLKPEEMQGGTFTVSNMGMLHVENFAAIINPGESAILAVSSAIPTPVVNADRQVVVRDVMKVTLSADHRVIDGALGAMFTNAVKRHLEDTRSWERELGVLPA